MTWHPQNEFPARGAAWGQQAAAWLLAGGLLAGGTCGCGGEADRLQDREPGPVPVEAAPVRRGLIEDRRTFSGTLETPARVMVAPEIGGRIKRMFVDLADPVVQGQVVAELDDGEFLQAVAQAEADLQVAEANRVQAVSALEIAERELQRMETLRDRGVASEATLDTARAEHLARKAAVQVAEARFLRDRAALEAVHIHLRQTKITAAWSEDSGQRVVAERHAEEGDTVSANTPLLTVVELDPLQAVIYVTERDYASLAPGQPVVLATDAWPGTTFAANVARIAPVFRESTRQARVELRVDNPEHRLKPGMFIRATVVLDREEDATLVPASALTRRDDQPGVFQVDANGRAARWCPVEVRLRDGRVASVRAAGLDGRVVTLGQQFLDDGSAIVIVSEDTGLPAP